MTISQDIQNLGDNIKTSFDNRIHFLGENTRNTKQSLQNARKFIGTCRRNRKAMAEQLHTDLGAFTENLSDTVKNLRRGFHRQQAVFHRECQSMHTALQKVQKEMAERRHAFANGCRGGKKSEGHTLKSRKH
ncbi:MAG: hypothetical protein HY559_00985 [Gammaproteobacteria bacterium]|nr:hypothetical protein [Gammaproteobacteria bacterium]